MKRYPSIPRKIRGKKRGLTVHVFDKIDGSNLRFEWDQKTGWHRFGSRRRVLDETHPEFGAAMKIFLNNLAEPIEAVAMKQKWSALVAFAEFWGARSIGGQHDPEEPKNLSLFDVAPYRHGFVGPERFLEFFGHLDTPNYLGEHAWNQEFVENVRRGECDGVTFEGVVGKAGDRHKIVMVKAKTQAWVDAIIKRYGEEEGQKIINS